MMDYVENLTYKTPKNISSTGLPKIYFSCHPEDFDELFPKISEAVWKQQNCSILYKKSLGEESRGELLEYLKENAYLFVFPITANFLSSDNYSLSQDFAFAEKNGIPMLPLFVDKNLEDEFNQKCGEFQCLYLNDVDTTAIEFKTKLERFLSENLINNDLLIRINKEFKKRVFISYRKMDRFFVNKLIDVLYENKKFRDVAIWYDEYLTPGESFNKNIESALAECDLAILATTPNVVRATKNSRGEVVDNYIIASEYPLVREKIMGVELAPTDRDQIMSTFPTLKALISIDQREDLYNTLGSLLGLSSVYDNTPQHKLLIGLAYLNGVNVPLNREKAISLITEAASDGNIEAMQRLAAFYFNGQFIKRSYEEARKWKKRLIITLKEDYGNTKSITRGHEYAKTLWDLIADELEQGELDSAYGLIYELDEFCQAFINENGKTKEIMHTYAGLLINTGDYYLNKPSLDKALECFSHALKIIGDDNPKVKALCLDRMGRILSNDRQSEAKAYIEEALKIRKKLKSDFDSDRSAQKRNVFQNAQYEFYYLEAMRHLAESHESMALLHTMSRNKNAAIAEYEKSTALRKEIYSRGKIQSDLVLLISFRLLLADMRLSDNDYEKALSDYTSAEGMINDNGLDKATWDLNDVYSHIVYCYIKISEGCENEKKYYRALDNYQKAWTYLELQLSLLSFVEQTNAFYIHNNMALVMFKMGGITQDKNLVNSARQIWGNLVLRFPDKSEYKLMKMKAEKLLEYLNKI